MCESSADDLLGSAEDRGALGQNIEISELFEPDAIAVPAAPLQSPTNATRSDTLTMRADDASNLPLDEIDAARAGEYALLSALLRRAPDPDFLRRLASVRGDATALGIAHAALAEAATEAEVDDVEREFFNLFVGIGRGELVPYASFYLTGFLNERPLARERDDLARLAIERAPDEVEPEDHAAILCEVMAGLVNGRFDAPLEADRIFFRRHLAPWMGRLFSNLESATAADFYRRVGTVGRVFMAIEADAFALANGTSTENIG
jgi:TorA maturation chaperone TorD